METTYRHVCQSIALAARRAGRDPKNVTLIAVSKNGTLEQINQLAALGQLDFGENRVQALLERMAQCDKSLRWHCIGQLQSNKVKYIINHASLVHSLDRQRLAGEMENQAKKNGTVARALIQVRFDEATGRGGVTPDEVKALLDGCASFPHLIIEGLMCLAPLGADERETRTCFASLRAMYDSLSSERWPNVRMQALSMGMSHDYLWAIECGATMVRVGSALFEAGL